jgi:hypothetical protein
MPGDLVILDYASADAKPRSLASRSAEFLACLPRRAAVRLWTGRATVAGLAAWAIAAWTVVVVFNVRMLLAASRFSTCGAARSSARERLAEAGLALFALPVLYVMAGGGRRWSGRLARTSAAVAAVWWLYNTRAAFGSWFPF